MSGSVRREVVTQLLRLTGHAVVERMRPSRPTALDEIPRSTEFLTPEWLTAALCPPHAGARMVGFSLGTGSDGSTSRRAVHVEYNDDGKEAGLGYRQQIFHGLFFCLFALGEGFLEPAMQPRPVSLANLERMAHMVVDLDCLDAV